MTAISESPEWISILSVLLVTAVFHGSMLATLAFKWKYLPPRFRLMATLAIILIFLGFIIEIIFVISKITIPICTIAQKISYVAFYAGFLVFDIYQLLKHSAITNASDTTRTIFLCVLLLRIASLIYTIAEIKGVFVIPNTGEDEFACKVIINDLAVYIEHGVSIFYELTLTFNFYTHMFKSKGVGIPLTRFRQNLIDYESGSFIFYFFAEGAFLLVFIFGSFDRGFYIILSSFYITLPAILFLYNTIIFIIYEKRLAERKKNYSGRSRRSFSDLGRLSFGRRLSRAEFSGFLGDSSWPWMKKPASKKARLEEINNFTEEIVPSTQTTEDFEFFDPVYRPTSICLNLGDDCLDKFKF